jgi:hypothetical protein
LAPLSGLGPVPGRRRDRDDHGIHDRAFAQHQALCREVAVDLLEDRPSLVLPLQQALELEQLGRIRSVLPARATPTEFRIDWLSYSESLVASSANPKHCSTIYMRSIRPIPFGGRPRTAFG